MHYVYLANGFVADQAQIDPYKVFYPDYASKFIEAPDEVTFGWKLENGQWIAPPAPDYSEINKQEAMSLLQATDWVELPSVSDPAVNPHLSNVNEFLAYRTQLRAIAVNPPTEPAVFPVAPSEIWL